jgi:hypothetical protein
MAVAAIAILAATPPVSRDALTHHLAIPKLFITAGAIREIPDIVFSYYPMNLDLLYCIPLYFGNDILPKYIHFLFGLITAWGIGHYLNNRFNRVYGFLGALLFLTTPIIVRLSSTVYVDLGLCCFTFFALRFLIKWKSQNFNSVYLILSGIMCGLALGTKYNALVGFLILTLMVLWLRARKPKVAFSADSPAELQHHAEGRHTVPSIIAASLFAMIALLVFSPWMIRNVIWTGNPIYPLYNDRINFENHEGDDSSRVRFETPPQKRFPPLVDRRLVYKESFWYTALVPLRIFFEGRDDNPQYFDGKLNPFLFLLSITAFLRSRNGNPPRNSEDFIWLAFAGLLIVFTFFTAPMRIRYIVAAVPSLIILSVSGIHTLIARCQSTKPTSMLPRMVKFAGFIAIAAALIYNIHYISLLYQRFTPIDYISGRLSREAYIQKYRPEYAIFRYTNTNLNKNDKILGVFIGNRRYYSDNPIDMNEAILLQAIKTASGPAEIGEVLARQGFTHLIMHRDIFRFWINNNVDESRKRIVRVFMDSGLVELNRSGDYSLLEIIQGKSSWHYPGSIHGGHP